MVAGEIAPERVAMPCGSLSSPFVVIGSPGARMKALRADDTDSHRVVRTGVDMSQERARHSTGAKWTSTARRGAAIPRTRSIHIAGRQVRGSEGALGRRSRMPVSPNPTVRLLEDDTFFLEQRRHAVLWTSIFTAARPRALLTCTPPAGRRRCALPSSAWRAIHSMLDVDAATRRARRPKSRCLRCTAAVTSTAGDHIHTCDSG